jgi:molecular chaperone DnaK (HSP70)
LPESTRFLVGIDLGTTNSVVAFVDTAAGDDARPEVFPIAQLIRPGAVESRSQLPSFLYLPAPEELAAESLRLPWTDASSSFVGAFAQTRGAEVPSRVVT